jgi:signal peptidase I
VTEPVRPQLLQRTEASNTGDMVDVPPPAQVAGSSVDVPMQVTAIDEPATADIVYTPDFGDAVSGDEVGVSDTVLVDGRPVDAELVDLAPLGDAAPGSPIPGLAPVDPEAIAGTTVLQKLTVVRDELIAWFKTLASAAVYATLIVTFGFQVARVEGLSMAPTLADQDRLIVNKFAYRLGSPRRGDIVMLYYPLNPDKSFVKRVIAEEGDTVRIVDGRVFVNDVPMQDDFVPPEYRSHDDFGPTVIPEGYYFVMGDHRNNSSDSRHWGFVPKKYIIGKVQLRWWPIPTAHMF